MRGCLRRVFDRVDWLALKKRMETRSMMNAALESKQTRYGKLAKDVDEFVKNSDKAPALDRGYY